MQFPDNESGEDTKPFVRLKDKESVKIIFRGEPLIFHTHWVGSTTVVCPGRAQCEACQSGQKNNFRFRLNAVVFENGQYVAKVFENGWKLYEYLREINKSASLEKYVINISRMGSTKNDTSYVPIPVSPISQDVLAKVAKVPLIDLSPHPKKEEEGMELKKTAPQTHEPVNNGSDFGGLEPAFTEDDLPF